MKNYPAPAHVSISSLKPYVGGTSSVKGVEKVIKLSSNEAAFGTNPLAISACEKGLEKLFRYPDGGAVKLKEAIGKAHNLSPERIVCGNGSDELIGLLCQGYLKEKDEVIITQYAFLMYRLYALTCGAQPVTVPEKDLKVDVQAILKAVTSKTKMIFIANPGNPTGTYLTKEEIIELCRKLPDNIMLVIDAAYAEFVDKEGYDAGAEIVEEFPNVVMLRTFSKIYGLGGVRLGWSYASKEITNVLNAIRGPFNVNVVAQIVGEAVLEDSSYVEKSFNHNKKWLEALPEAFKAIGLEMTPSVTNFVLVHFPKTKGKTAAEADAFLLNKGIIVRRVDAYGLPDSLRMTIGKDDEMNALLSALKEFMTQE